MRNLVFVLGALYSSIYFAPSIYHRCMENSVDIYYTRDLFHFRWDWKADKLSVAETILMESKKIFTPMPMDPLDWTKWLKEDLVHESSQFQFMAKNDKKVSEPYSFLAIYLMGLKWKSNLAVWPKPDWSKYVLNDVVAASDFELEEVEYLTKEWTKKYFTHFDFQLSAQSQFLGLFRNAIKGNSEVSRRMEQFFRNISPVDFMQGTRAVAALRDVISDMVEADLPSLQTRALSLGTELVADSKISYDEIIAKVDDRCCNGYCCNVWRSNNRSVARHFNA